MDFTPIVNQIIDTVAGLIAALLVPALIAILVNWLKEKGVNINAAKQGQLTELSKEAVMASSQMAKNMTINRDQRKPVAVEHLVQRAGMLGIEISKDAAAGVVEAAINRLKRERGVILDSKTLQPIDEQQ